MSEINLDSYFEETVLRKYEIEAILENIHGEHSTRTQMLSELVFEATDELTEEEIEKIEKRSRARKKIEEIHTFPKDQEGNLLVPLGGQRGYIMGALRYTLQDLYKDRLKDKEWEGYGMVTYLEHGIFIYPEWVKAGKEISNPLDQPKRYKVETKGPSHGMMDTFYDYIAQVPPFKLTIEVTNPKILENIFLKMLAHVQRLGIGPKGRGRIRFIKVTQTKG